MGNRVRLQPLKKRLTVAQLKRRARKIAEKKAQQVIIKDTLKVWKQIDER